MAWAEPIKRRAENSVTIEGVDPTAEGLLRISVFLSAGPPSEWATHFDRGAGVPFKLSLHKPRVVGPVIDGRVEDDKLEEYVAVIDEMIDASNDYYVAEVLPAIEAAEKRTTDAAAAKAERLRSAQDRANDL
jgi:hypothetical protein